MSSLQRSYAQFLSAIQGKDLDPAALTEINRQLALVRTLLQQLPNYPKEYNDEYRANARYHYDADQQLVDDTTDVLEQAAHGIVIRQRDTIQSVLDSSEQSTGIPIPKIPEYLAYSVNYVSTVTNSVAGRQLMIGLTLINDNDNHLVPMGYTVAPLRSDIRQAFGVVHSEIVPRPYKYIIKVSNSDNLYVYHYAEDADHDQVKVLYLFNGSYYDISAAFQITYAKVVNDFRIMISHATTQSSGVINQEFVLDPSTESLQSYLYYQTNESTISWDNGGAQAIQGDLLELPIVATKATEQSNQSIISVILDSISLDLNDLATKLPLN